MADYKRSFESRAQTLQRRAARTLKRTDPVNLTRSGYARRTDTPTAAEGWL